MQSFSLSRGRLVLIGFIFIVISVYGWMSTNSTQVAQTSTSTGLISDLSNPFGSGNSGMGESGVTGIPVLSLNIHSGTQVVETNLVWSGRTLSGVYYQFGSGNPMETDKTVVQLIEMNRDCLATGASCESYLSSAGEYVSSISNDDGSFKEFNRPPSRMTPEIEYLVYSFLSNPIIRQSSESCSGFFWPDDMSGRPIYPNEDMGEISPENWWNPYRIDINQFIIVNPTTGRKELVLDPIWTLNTQIQLPAVTRETTGNYTNTKLTNCLQKNNQLHLLQSHVASHYERLRKAWYGN